MVFTISTVTLKDNCAITDPVFIFKWEQDATGPQYIKNINYLHVAEFGRYYYVTDIRMLRDRLIELSCHVDVLMSFKSEIRANNAIILRQENNYNLYLNDGVFKVYQNPVVLTREFPAGFTSQSFVLAVAGNDIRKSLPL